MGLSQDEIFEKVQEALVDALGVDDDEVNREATLVGDLGAESIDFLDIVFNAPREPPKAHLLGSFCHPSWRKVCPRCGSTVIWIGAKPEAA